MSVILILKDRVQLEVQGEEAEARRIMSSRRPVVVKSKKNGRTVIIRGRDVLFAEIVTAAEELAQAVQAQMKAAAEAKKNPNPGREPKLTPPGGRA